MFSDLGLELLESNYLGPLRDEVKLVPELTESFVEEGNCTLSFHLSERGEHEFIYELLVGLQREVVFAIEVVALDRYFEVGCVIQGVLDQDLEDNWLANLRL